MQRFGQEVVELPFYDQEAYILVGYVSQDGKYYSIVREDAAEQRKLLIQEVNRCLNALGTNQRDIQKLISISTIAHELLRMI